MEDRRGMGAPLAIGGGIGGLILTVLFLLVRGFGGGGGGQPGREGVAPEADDRTKHFVATVLGFTEQVWGEQFPKQYGMQYQKPKLVLFSDAVRTGCGDAPSAVGPFYCPADKTVYLDPTFFDELQQKLSGSKAEFSQAYVIAHEVGHHVQNLLGYEKRVGQARGRGKDAGNQASVRLELMADYLAGVWAHYGQEKFKFIEPGDIESALTTAKAIGDDRLQKRAGSFVHPEQFTHGTSRQRVYFFTRGFKTGDASRATLDKFFDSKYDPRTGEIEDF